MTLDKLTAILVVDRIEDCLPTWIALGYAVTVRVPDEGVLDFVMLAGTASELMLQTKTSLAVDLPDVAKRGPSTLLYADVGSLDEAKSALPAAVVIVPYRETFYGAKEAWVELPGGTVLGLSEHPK